VIVGLLFVLGLIVVGGLAWLEHVNTRARNAAVLTFATERGLTFEVEDSESLDALGFALFDRGDGRRIRRVARGRHRDRTIRVFDFEYYVRSGRNNSKQWYRYTVVMVTVPAAMPQLRLQHESITGRLANLVGFDDVELEWGEFNRKYRVLSHDQRFAFSLLDGRMMEWLMLGADSAECIETLGPFVLLAYDRLDPKDWPIVLDVAHRFCDLVPEVVYSTYPPR
jgi:hypothetical protein